MSKQIYVVISCSSGDEGPKVHSATAAFTDKEEAKKYMNQLYENAYESYREELAEDYCLEDEEDDDQREILKSLIDERVNVKKEETSTRYDDSFTIWYGTVLSDSWKYCKVESMSLK